MEQEGHGLIPGRLRWVFLVLGSEAEEEGGRGGERASDF